MAIHQIRTTQNLPITMAEAWDFMSSPYNLQTITPDNMGFHIINGVKPEDKMYAGQIIAYTVKPLAGIPLEWVTEITTVVHHQYFIDEQRFGPYTMWHHEHHLKEIPGGIKMDDIIHYKLPMGILGNIANALLVRKKLKTIFDYRYRKLEEIFGKM